MSKLKIRKRLKGLFVRNDQLTLAYFLSKMVIQKSNVKIILCASYLFLGIMVMRYFSK